MNDTAEELKEPGKLVLRSAEIEQTKLLANAFDRTSTACITVGVVTPIAAMLYGIGNIVFVLASP